ncbi:MAG: ABC transporter ATP-binding protein, partial [Rhizobacter sp.]|nr:ABC transporter ATP-binding protein [Rhizobacter sp.]
CGKSTLLRLIAGLEDISSGELRIDGERVNDLKPKQRGVAMVFQSYALYPHMTAYQNMAFGLELSRHTRQQIDARVRGAAETLALTPLLQRLPKDLSGGQRQRVAIGRAIVRAPKVFLFDEPLSNLDAALRGQTRIEIAELHRNLGATTVYVTHDQVEAMTLADRVVVLRDGEIEQVGAPLELYDRPANQFVAQFIGTPQMNVVDTAALPALRGIVGAANAPDGFIGVRPENVIIKPAGAGALSGKVELVESLGADTLIYTQVGDKAKGVQFVARQNTRTEVHPGDTVGLDIAPASFHLFDRKGKVVSTAGAR